MVLSLPLLLSLFATPGPAQDQGVPPGFVPLFNGTDLEGWKGSSEPMTRATMSSEDLAKAQAEKDAEIAKHWRAEDGEIVNDGKGPHLCTAQDYGDIELWLDWKITAGADSGIYLRGTPQVQIWDPVNGIGQAKVGSGGSTTTRNTSASRWRWPIDRPSSGTPSSFEWWASESR